MLVRMKNAIEAHSNQTYTSDINVAGIILHLRIECYIKVIIKQTSALEHEQ